MPMAGQVEPLAGGRGCSSANEAGEAGRPVGFTCASSETRNVMRRGRVSRKKRSIQACAQ